MRGIISSHFFLCFAAPPPRCKSVPDCAALWSAVLTEHFQCSLVVWDQWWCLFEFYMCDCFRLKTGMCKICACVDVVNTTTCENFQVAPAAMVWQLSITEQKPHQHSNGQNVYFWPLWRWPRNIYQGKVTRFMHRFYCLKYWLNFNQYKKT